MKIRMDGVLLLAATALVGVLVAGCDGGEAGALPGDSVVETGYLSCVSGQPGCPDALQCVDADGAPECVPLPDSCIGEVNCACAGATLCAADTECYDDSTGLGFQCFKGPQQGICNTDAECGKDERCHSGPDVCYPSCPVCEDCNGICIPDDVVPPGATSCSSHGDCAEDQHCNAEEVCLGSCDDCTDCNGWCVAGLLQEGDALIVEQAQALHLVRQLKTPITLTADGVTGRWPPVQQGSRVLLNYEMGPGKPIVQMIKTDGTTQFTFDAAEADWAADCTRIGPVRFWSQQSAFFYQVGWTPACAGPDAPAPRLRVIGLDGAPKSMAETPSNFHITSSTLSAKLQYVRLEIAGADNRVRWGVFDPADGGLQETGSFVVDGIPALPPINLISGGALFTGLGSTSTTIYRLLFNVEQPQVLATLDQATILAHPLHISAQETEFLTASAAQLFRINGAGQEAIAEIAGGAPELQLAATPDGTAVLEATLSELRVINTSTGDVTTKKKGDVPKWFQGDGACPSVAGPIHMSADGQFASLSVAGGFKIGDCPDGGEENPPPAESWVVNTTSLGHFSAPHVGRAPPRISKNGRAAFLSPGPDGGCVQPMVYSGTLNKTEPWAKTLCDPVDAWWVDVVTD